MAADHRPASRERPRGRAVGGLRARPRWGRHAARL